MNLRRALLPVVAAGMLFAACSDSVDRSGTVDNLVKEMDKSGVKVDKECARKALDKFTDDQLLDANKKIKAGDMSDPIIEQLGTELTPCLGG